MPRRIKPPASPALSLMRAKAQRERIKLAGERRAKAKRLAHIKKTNARTAREAREDAAYEAQRRWQARAAAEAASPQAPTPARAAIDARLEARDAERWRALGIDVEALAKARG